MGPRALWLTTISLTACYFGSDKYAKSDEAPPEAGVDAGDTTALIGMDSAVHDATVEVPVDASDATVDAGCQADPECPLAFPQCRNGDCVPCTEQSNCARFPDTPACSASGTCVVCTAEHAQSCTGDTPACDTATNSCVQCASDGDCPNQAQAACGANHTCETCSADAQCERFGRVCDTRTGVCVRCRPETEAADCRTDKTCDPKTAECAGTACNLLTLTCGSLQRGTVGTCDECNSDSECVSDHRCIAMTYGDNEQFLGGFCLKRFSTGCLRGYTHPISRKSASGIPAETYCGVNERLSSCAAVAVARLSKSCTTDDSCGAPGARCETVSGLANICTYGCDVAAECVSSSFLCVGPLGNAYCGAN